jgi:hypothetical protein
MSDQPSSYDTFDLSEDALEAPGGDAAAEGAAVSYFDLNGDQSADLTTIDTDGDGTANVELVDVDADGVADYQVFDLDADGVADYALADNNADGVADAALVDTDNDGVMDTLFSLGGASEDPAMSEASASAVEDESAAPDWDGANGETAEISEQDLQEASEDLANQTNIQSGMMSSYSAIYHEPISF